MELATTCSMLSVACSIINRLRETRYGTTSTLFDCLGLIRNRRSCAPSGSCSDYKTSVPFTNTHACGLGNWSSEAKSPEVPLTFSGRIGSRGNEYALVRLTVRCGSPG